METETMAVSIGETAAFARPAARKGSAGLGGKGREPIRQFGIIDPQQQKRLAAQPVEDIQRP
jgi:hypothetical protein